MSFAKNSTPAHVLSKAQELKYQVTEAKYHLEGVRTAMQEALYHLQKSKYHSLLFKQELNNKI